MDSIKIEDLEVYAHHGIYKEEKELGQKFLVNAEFFLPLYETARTEDLEKTVDYGECCQFIYDHMVENSAPLLETVAENLSQDIFQEYPQIRKMVLEIKKPNAPIRHSFKSVSVKIEREFTRAFLSLGSNMGDREKNLKEAVELIKNHSSIRLKRSSSIYETKAWGKEDQDDFLNLALEVETTLSPTSLLRTLQKYEDFLGRERLEKWGPRTIDIDILFYGDRVISEDELIIPHPYIPKRAFVLDPMEEIAGNFIHPTLKKTIRELREDLEGKNALG